MSPTTLFKSLLVGAAFAPMSLLLMSAPAGAADDTARVERLEKQVNELRAIVFQARNTGHPVEVKDAGPDPAVAALSQRVDDLEATLRKLQGGSEISNHDLDEAKARLDAERTDRAAQTQALTDRIVKLESDLANLTAPASAPPTPDAATRGAHGPAPKAKTAAAPPVAPPVAAPDTAAPGRADDAPSAGNPAQEFKTARTLLASGDYGGASQAFQSFVSAHPTDAHTGEAYYWLGESYYVRDLNGDATAAYARALNGWPKTTWAPDAVIKLARTLAATNRQPQACAAMAEYGHHYSATATPAMKARAELTRTKIGCPG